MAEMESLRNYKSKVWARLEELSKMDFPQFRTYRKPDGTWVDREPVPEYIELQELSRIWREIIRFETWFSMCHNHLAVSLRLTVLANNLAELPEPFDTELQHRIAASVYQNGPVNNA